MNSCRSTRKVNTSAVACRSWNINFSEPTERMAIAFALMKCIMSLITYKIKIIINWGLHDTYTKNM